MLRYMTTLTTRNYFKNKSFIISDKNSDLAEMWVCSNPAGLYKDLHTPGKDLYYYEYVRENYTKELPII